VSAGVQPDPFDVAADGDPIPRDQWGRPIIFRPDLPDGPCPEVRYCKITTSHGHYARMSTFDGWLDDGMGLSNWKVRHVTLATARASASTRALLSSCWYPTKDNPCPELDEYIDIALTEAKRDGEESLHSADWGTAVHRFTVPDSPPHAPERLLNDLDAYDHEIAQRGWGIVGTELFVVNDALRIAGTLDHLYRLPSGAVIVGDKKTGQLRPLSFSIQVAGYAYGERYDPITYQRSPIHPDLRLDVGVIAHIPLGQGRCDMIPIDLVLGHRRGQQARDAYEARRTANSLLLPIDILDTI
jgi:hypothetical protein